MPANKKQSIHALSPPEKVEEASRNSQSQLTAKLAVQSDYGIDFSEILPGYDFFHQALRFHAFSPAFTHTRTHANTKLAHTH